MQICDRSKSKNHPYSSDQSKFQRKSFLLDDKNAFQFHGTICTKRKKPKKIVIVITTLF
jgi:hypothetical protein